MNSFKQPTKHAVRSKALAAAITMLTQDRESTAIVPLNHVRRVLGALAESEVNADQSYAGQCESGDIDSWESFRTSQVGARAASDLTVAYLAGPEPSNDLQVLIQNGIRPENIWAFENESKTFAEAFDDVERVSLRGVKLIELSLSDYLEGNPRRFDIIYLDACAPLPSHEQKTSLQLASIFLNSALAPLGVLITNFSEPDTTAEAGHTLKKYGRLVAAYLYPKPYLDTVETESHGGIFNPSEWGLPFMGDPAEPDDKEPFIDLVQREFPNFYGCFITRHIADIASIIAPASRLGKTKLASLLVMDRERALKRADLLASWQLNDDPRDWSELSESEQEEQGLKGQALSEPSTHSLLFTLAHIGLLAANPGLDLGQVYKKFFDSWVRQTSGKASTALPDQVNSIKWYYGAKCDSTQLNERIRHLAAFTKQYMPWFCDVPTDELGFYPAFAQLAHPAHCNFSKVQRFSYIAEGKSTRMYTDVIPLDECRYVYDWLSTPNLFTNDWTQLSSQMVFRMALDGIAKSAHFKHDDFLFGCHVIGIDSDEFPVGELAPREDFSPTEFSIYTRSCAGQKETEDRVVPTSESAD